MASRTQDIKNAPCYSIAEAARFLRLSKSTLRDWTLAHRYDERAPILKLPDPKFRYLSFNNLVEAYVLDSIRRKYKLPFGKVKKALNSLRKDFRSERPLLTEEILTDKFDLFVERHGNLFNVSQTGQIEIKQAIEAYLTRVERNPSHVPVKLFPLTRPGSPIQPRFIVIDPSISFGKPAIASTGVPTSSIFERFNAGDSMEELALDYHISREEVEEAIRCEQIPVAA